MGSIYRMFREFDYVPFFWKELICIGSLTCIALIASFISSRFFPKSQDNKLDEGFNSVIGILSSGFSILLVFIIITNWGAFLRAQEKAIQEASFLGIMTNNIAVFPDEAYVKLKEAIHNYTVAVRIDEWQSMSRGKESQHASRALRHLNNALHSFEPTTRLERLYYGHVLSNLNNIQKLRRARIGQLSSVIPRQFGLALILGSIGLAFILGLIRSESKLINLIPAILFVMILGFNLAIAFSLDFPFSGDISISNKYFYQGVLNTFKD
jgi:hypothetical protein